MKPLIIAAIVCFVLSAVVFIYWGATGAHFVTQYEIAVTKEIEDDFGDIEEVTTMEPGFQFGLTPSDRIVDAALPLGGGLAGLGAVLLAVAMIRRRKQEDVVAA